jgi:nucleoside-diphosphate-sugar epimerase
MRILSIGGTGFIGAHVLRRLVGDNHDVAVFHRGKTPAELPHGVQSIHGDRKNLSAFAPDFRKFAPDLVLDVTPYVEQDALTVMNTFRGIARRVVAISSMDVYAAYGRFRRSENGEPEMEPFNELAPLRSILYPYRTFAQSADDFEYNYDKILVERVVMNDTKIEGTVLRLPVVYGPADKQHRTFEYVKRMRDGRPAVLLADEKFQWRWTRSYVENVAAAIALAVFSEQAANRIYNVGPPEAPTEAEWVQSIGCAAGWDGKIVAISNDLMPDHLTNDYDYRHTLAADTSRIRKELGYVEPVSREEALERTVTWEQENPPMEIDTGRFNYAAEDEVLGRLGR